MPTKEFLDIDYYERDEGESEPGYRVIEQDLVMKQVDFPDLYNHDLHRLIASKNVIVKEVATIDNIIQSEDISEQDIVIIKDQSTGIYYLEYKSSGKTMLSINIGVGGVEIPAAEGGERRSLTKEQGAAILTQLVQSNGDIALEAIGIFEQLSPKGIALLSYIKSSGEQSNQPFVATTMEDIIHAANVINDCREGDRVSIIYHQIAGDFHKTVITLEKTAEGINAYYLDTGHYQSGYVFHRTRELDEGLRTLGISAKHYVSTDKLASLNRRQCDYYQCGTFAIKDARTLTKEFLEVKGPIPDDASHLYPGGTGTFQMPTSALKGVQSRRTRSIYKDYMRHGIVKNDALEKLEEFYERYKDPNAYARKFSSKNKKRVLSFIQNNSEEMAAEAIRSFSARGLSADSVRQINDHDRELVVKNIAISIIKQNMLLRQAVNIDDILFNIYPDLDEKAKRRIKEICLRFSVGYVDKLRGVPRGADLDELNRQMFSAVSGDSLDLVDNLSKAGASVNLRSDSGSHWTLLHFAVANSKSISMTKKLLSLGADPNLTDSGGWLPIHLAALFEKEEHLKFYIEGGVSIYAKANHGETVLDIIIRDGKRKSLLACNEAFMNKNKINLLQSVIAEKRYDLIPGLINLGLGVDDNVPYEPQWSALHWAANFQDEKAMEALLDCSADPNNSDKKGGRALHILATKDHNVENIDRIIAHGGDILARNNEGNSPLDIAFYNGKLDNMRCMVESYNKEYELPILHRLCTSDSQKDTLHRLIYSGCVDINTPTGPGGWRHVHFAVKYNSPLCLDILKGFGVDINGAGINGWTPLHLAIHEGNADMVRKLVDMGADIHKKNDKGVSPFDMAGGNKNIMRHMDVDEPSDLSSTNPRNKI